MGNEEALAEFQNSGAGYQYKKNENELFELVSPMSIADADVSWPLDESKIDYKRMAKNWFDDRSEYHGTAEALGPVIDTWCELLEKA
jgi:hypothetical protein